MAKPEPVLLDAAFNPRVRSYWLLNGTLVLAVTLVGIPLLPFWWILGHYLTGRYLDFMSCRLTPRSLKMSKGILVRQEKTVPLDKITDVALVEGPIMRILDLQAVKIETAGSSTGAFLQIVGIEKTRDFRDAVLEQRDRVVAAYEGGAVPQVPSGSDPALLGEGGAGARAGADAGTVEVLTEIRDALLRIEARLPEA